MTTTATTTTTSSISKYLGFGVAVAAIAIIGFVVQLQARHVENQAAAIVAPQVRVIPIAPPAPVVAVPAPVFVPEPVVVPAPKPVVRKPVKHRVVHHVQTHAYATQGPVQLVEPAPIDPTLCFPWGDIDLSTGHRVGSCLWLGFIPSF